MSKQTIERQPEEQRTTYIDASDLTDCQTHGDLDVVSEKTFAFRDGDTLVRVVVDRFSVVERETIESAE